MRTFTTFVGAGAIVLLSAATSFAAPCATGQTAGKMDSKDKSSKVEPSSTGNVSPGAKAESPGTVGAMNNAGSDKATSLNDAAKQQEGKPTAAQSANDC